MFRISKLLIVACSVLLAADALATTVATAPVRINDGGPGDPRQLSCAIVNVGFKDLEVTVTTELGSTTVVGPIVLSPQERLGFGVTNTSGSSVLGYCRFDFTGGSKKHVRASACAMGAVGEACRAPLPAS